MLIQPDNNIVRITRTIGKREDQLLHETLRTKDEDLLQYWSLQIYSWQLPINNWLLEIRG